MTTFCIALYESYLSTEYHLFLSSSVFFEKLLSIPFCGISAERSGSDYIEDDLFAIPIPGGGGGGMGFWASDRLTPAANSLYR